MKEKTIQNDLSFLRQKSVEVDFKKDDYLSYIQTIKKYCLINPVYALAPVQIGIPKRIIYFKNTTHNMDNNVNPNYDEEQVYINPTILQKKGHTRFLERCNSCMDYVGIVDRPYEIDVKYFDINGKEHTEKIKGFKSTIFCHEFDHLNGILHIDLASDIRKMTYEETREYRQKYPYQVLSKE